MTPIRKLNARTIVIGLCGITFALLAASFLGIGDIPWLARAAEETHCCKAGDTTLPTELVKQVPKSTRGGVGLPPGPLRGPARSWLTTLGSIQR